MVLLTGVPFVSSYPIGVYVAVYVPILLLSKLLSMRIFLAFLNVYPGSWKGVPTSIVIGVVHKSSTLLIAEYGLMIERSSILFRILGVGYVLSPSLDFTYSMKLSLSV